MHGFCTVFTLFWTIQLKCLQLSLSSSCIISRASDFLAPFYPTQTLQYSAHATLLHHTLAWLYQIVLLSDSTLLCYTLYCPHLYFDSACCTLHHFMPIDLIAYTIRHYSTAVYTNMALYLHDSTVLYLTLFIDLTILDGSISGLYHLYMMYLAI